MTLFADQVVTLPSYDELFAGIGSDTLFYPRIVGALQMGKDGLVILGERNIILDAPNRRILVNDGTTDRVLIGQF